MNYSINRDNYERRNKLIGRGRKIIRKNNTLERKAKEKILKKISYEVAAIESSIRLSEHDQSVYLLEGDSKDRIIVLPVANLNPGKEYKIINSTDNDWEFLSENDTDEIPIIIRGGTCMTVISDGVKKWWMS